MEVAETTLGQTGIRMCREVGGTRYNRWGKIGGRCVQRKRTKRLQGPTRRNGGTEKRSPLPRNRSLCLPGKARTRVAHLAAPSSQVTLPQRRLTQDGKYP